MDTKEKILEFVKESTFSDKSKIQFDTLIFKEGFFDSMGFITLIAFLESTFNIQADDTDLVEENFESVNAMSEYVSRKLNLN
jgi:acyl carrier protein